MHVSCHFIIKQLFMFEEAVLVKQKEILILNR